MSSTPISPVTSICTTLLMATPSSWATGSSNSNGGETEDNSRLHLVLGTSVDIKSSSIIQMGWDALVLLERRTLL